VLRVGIDLGGTKIEGIGLAADGAEQLRLRRATPQGDYPQTLLAVRDLVHQIEQQSGTPVASVGIAHPGAISPASGLIKNANSTCLNGRPLQQDLEAALGRPVRMANDANCLALSEACDGAAAGARLVFAVILGTGVGGGWSIDGAVVEGHQAIAGEWGHNSLPWMRPEWDEFPGPMCWCGRPGCIETFLSGPGMAADHRRVSGEDRSAEAIVAAAESGAASAQATLARYEDRLARGLAHVINLMDPDVIVLGGGVSRIARLYRYVPALWDQWVFSDALDTRLVPALHGDSSGVRGAAWLWPAPAAGASSP
jgi:fructokinase